MFGSFNSLELLVGLPLLAGLFCLIFPDRFKDLARIISLLVSAAIFAGSIYLFINRPGPWELGSDTILASDNLSSFIALGISFFALTVSVYSLTYQVRSLGRYFGYILIKDDININYYYILLQDGENSKGFKLIKN